jgi:LEA14-like dessication related protein
MPASLCRALALAVLYMSLGACALFSPSDPLIVQVAGLEPDTGNGLEWRMRVKVRVQNPNRDSIEYSGVALTLSVNGQPLASGVSPAQGTVAGYSETVLAVPVTVSAFSVVRQAFGLADLQPGQAVPYRIEGKLDRPGLLGAVRFTDSGHLSTSSLGLPGTTR